MFEEAARAAGADTDAAGIFSGLDVRAVEALFVALADCVCAGFEAAVGVPRKAGAGLGGRKACEPVLEGDVGTGVAFAT